MRLMIEMKGRDSERVAVPINYRPLIHGMIYHMLADFGDYAANQHAARTTGGRTYKGFTFSPLLGSYQVEGYTIIFTGAITLEIRSIDPVMTAFLYHSILSKGEIRIGDVPLTVTHCTLEEKHIREREARIRMVSPVVVYSTDETNYCHFFSPADEEFYSLIYGNAKRKGAFFQLLSPFELSLSLAPGYRPKKQVSNFKHTILEGWYGEFLIKGSPEYIDMLYKTGLGAKNTEGFGMFEIITE